MDDVNQLLRERFEKINAAELAAMKDRREEEGLRLDFKRGSKDGEPSKDDLANLRRAVSGFANSEGGIILWGVDSTGEGDRSDRNCFSRVLPIENGAKFVARLQELTGDTTSPPLSGVFHAAIPVEGGSVVKTFVPASDQGHQDARELVYWRRYADRFRKMQDFEIREMLARRARPRLELWWERIPDSHKASDMREIQHAYLLGLKNTGRGLAQFPCLSLTWDAVAPQFNQYGLGVSLDRTGLPRKPSSVLPNLASEVFAGGTGDVIHPGQLLQVTRVGMYRAHAGVKTVKFEIFAEGIPPVSDAFRVSSEGAFVLGTE